MVPLGTCLLEIQKVFVPPALDLTKHDGANGWRSVDYWKTVSLSLSGLGRFGFYTKDAAWVDSCMPEGFSDLVAQRGCIITHHLTRAIRIIAGYETCISRRCRQFDDVL